MKLLQSRNILTYIIVVALVSVLSLSKELPSNSFNKRNSQEIVPSYYLDKYLVKDLTQGTEFSVLDSLANAYSYFTNDQQPFVYHANSNTLITIKRGYVDLTKEPGYSGTNTKDNLFIHTSQNWGKTWGAGELVFNSKNYSGALARYPSVFGFEYDEKLALIFTSPMTGGTGWEGFINGLYYDGSSVATQSKQLKINGKDYGWNGTDSKMVGGLIAGEPYGLAVSIVMPPGGVPLSDNSAIAYRKTTDFDEWKPVIPSQWASNIFVTPVPTPTGRTDSLRNSNVINLRLEENNIMYMAAYGRFMNATNTEEALVGVSNSIDDGTTWSNFDILPYSVLSDYAQSVGILASALNIGNQSFTVLPNGNYSFIVGLNEDTTITGTTYADALHGLFEINKTNSNWTIRKIADNSGYVLAYINEQGTSINNQMGDEVQVARSVDGTKILAKWVDFIDAIATNGDTIRNYSTDIFVSARDVSKNTWGTPKNITESEIYDRITWIPDYVPNDLKNIPILKVETIPTSTTDENEKRLNQRRLESLPQYVMYGQFDATTEVGVTENDNYILNLNVIPNPVSENSFVTYTLNEPGNVNIELFDMMGRRINSIFSGEVTGGYNAVRLNSEGISTGAYLVRLTTNGKTITKNINIIK